MRRVLLAAAALATLACSQSFGIRLRAEASGEVELGCLEEGLALDYRPRSQPGWEVLEFDGPVGRASVDLNRREGNDQVYVSWTRINQAWTVAECAQMRPYLEGVYARLAAACPTLPARAVPLDLKCSEW